MSLAAARKIDWQDRGHFLAMAARMMRRYLINRGRSRPSVQFLPMEGLPERVLGERSDVELAVAVDELLEDLAKQSPQQREIVELKFCLGKSAEEAAEAARREPAPGVILLEIRQGGMGVVNEALDRKRGVRIAIKAANPYFSSNRPVSRVCGAWR